MTGDYYDIILTVQFWQISIDIGSSIVVTGTNGKTDSRNITTGFRANAFLFPSSIGVWFDDECWWTTCFNDKCWWATCRYLGWTIFCMVDLNYNFMYLLWRWMIRLKKRCFIYLGDTFWNYHSFFLSINKFHCLFGSNSELIQTCMNSGGEEWEFLWHWAFLWQGFFFSWLWMGSRMELNIWPF